MSRGLARAALRWSLRAGTLFAILAATSAAIGAIGTSRAQAEMMAMGADMLQIPERPTTDPSAGEQVVMNGAELGVRRGRTPRSVDEVLAAAAASCGGRITEPTRDPALPGPGAIFRAGDGQHGFVACLDPSLDPERGLLDRVRATGASADALTLPLAYLYAERRGDSTHFVGFRSDHPVDLGTMFPRGGDAPGRDPDGFPRAPGSRRTLGLRVAGQPYDAIVYLDRAGRMDALVHHYESALPRAGWTIAAPWRVDEGPGPRQASVLVERAGTLALVLVAEDQAGTSTTFASMEATREQ